MSREGALFLSIERLCQAGFIDVATACPYAPPGSIYPEEALDAFLLLAPDARRKAFPFFDADAYLAQLESPLPETANPLEHFLLHGLAHLLSPHPLIRPSAMLQARPDLFRGKIDVDSFVSALVEGTSDPGPFFWSGWYRARNGLEAEENPLLHFLQRGAELNWPPNPFFDPVLYAKSAGAGAPSGGWALVEHFLTSGAKAGARTTDRFDPDWYALRYSEARASEQGPLLHYLTLGRALGYAALPGEAESAPRSAGVSAPTLDFTPSEDPVSSLARRQALYDEVASHRRASVLAYREGRILPVSAPDALQALQGLDLREDRAVEIDVLIPCHDEFETTVHALLALRAARTRRAFRVFLADDASTDPRMLALQKVPGLVYLRNAENLHFLRTCNRAFAETRAPYLLLLNNDTQVFDHALDRLVDAIESAPDIGAAAPMLLYPNGRLQEAGCALRRDGDSAMVGVGDDPTRRGYNYRRPIDYGSGAGLMLRRTALAGQLFDERFVPAYCEDADLCLRLGESGWRVVYEPGARIVHHLSVSTGRAPARRRVQLVRRNQQKLAEKWPEALRRRNRARVLAFYLPQFHPVACNDLWWGRGFTEWSNVTRAAPSFEGHYQPHLPADLGFYDLRRVETMGEQQALARRYGVEGFAVYYYNFGSQRVLEQPMEALLRRPDIDFRFALCWANENWSRHWDGGERAPLFEQDYGAATLASVIADFARFAADPRAIRVGGKPLVMVYRPLLLPDPARFAADLRTKFAQAGMGEAHLVYVESMEAIDRAVRPPEIGFDACVEFPPQGIAEPLSRGVALRKLGWDGRLYDYAATARNSVLRDPPGYPRYPGVIPGWDNTARQPLKGTTLVGAEPETFQAYVEMKLEEMANFHVGDHRLLFVNAWNEWAEGAHLEPDRAYGHRWLAALRQALVAKGLTP